MTLVCVISVAFMTLASCGSKVNQKELNEKIENASENEGLGDVTFTDGEYDFMAKYILDRISEKKEFQLDDPEDEMMVYYMAILSMAQYINKLKGDVKKDYEEIQKKIQSMDADSMTPDYSFDEATEVVVE